MMLELYIASTPAQPQHATWTKRRTCKEKCVPKVYFAGGLLQAKRLYLQIWATPGYNAEAESNCRFDNPAQVG